MLRISVTTIDQFKRYLTDQDRTNASGEITRCAMSQDDLIRYITEKPAPSKFMELGTAFHDILQNTFEREKHDQDGKPYYESLNGIVFPADVVNECYDYFDHNFPFEVKEETIMTTNSGELVKVIAVADQLKGRHVIELKSNWTQFDVKKYWNSCQWRFYIETFQVDRVLYKVFEFKEKATEIELKKINCFAFDAYPGVYQDNKNLLSEFVTFIHLNNLESYFKDK